MDEDRLIKIETALMHHDRQIADLEEVVDSQRREIEHLRKYIERALSRIDDMGQGASEDGKNVSAIEQALRDKPPHY